MSWLHHLSWASWPRTYVAGLFDVPNLAPAVPALVPAPDWLRFRIVVDGEPLVLHSGELLEHERTLDLTHGLMLAIPPMLLAGIMINPSIVDTFWSLIRPSYES